MQHIDFRIFYLKDLSASIYYYLKRHLEYVRKFSLYIIQVTSHVKIKLHSSVDFFSPLHTMGLRIISPGCCFMCYIEFLFVIINNRKELIN